MPERKPHIVLEGFSQESPYLSRSRGGDRTTPEADRVRHGEKLASQYSEILDDYAGRREQFGAPITQELGIYVEIISAPNCELPLDSLDNRSFDLRSVRKDGQQEVALVFIPESKRNEFKQKVAQYLSPEKGKVKVEITITPLHAGTDDLLTQLDSFEGRTNLNAKLEKGLITLFIPEGKVDEFRAKFDSLPYDFAYDIRPKNYTLLNSIEKIRLAEIEAFWTGSNDHFPEDLHENRWWELWLKRSTTHDETALDIANQLAARIGAQLGNTSLTFYDSVVVLVKASATNLAQSIDLISNLEELRPVKETPSALLRSSPREQREWTDDLLSRTQIDPDAKTSISILDYGVNYNHPLLSLICNEEQADTWHPSWPNFDHYDPLHQQNADWDHGSKQAGLAMYGDLQAALETSGDIVVNHRLESGRILPPQGNNDPELYGAVTIGTAAKLKTPRPDWNRVYSLAVTAEHDSIGGQPSSWSAEIDQYSFGLEDEFQRLFIISAGNTIDISPTNDYWAQIQLEQVEDPAQSWNALVVGAYTEKTTIDDSDFDGWSPLAPAGDVSPATRSSVNWGWAKQAPYKPDIVAEGGNRILSPGRDEVDENENVELLTTSGRADTQLFESTRDTSAACALVSHHAATLMSEYPDYWPETIRGLLVHSARWTDRMKARFEELKREHPTSTVAKQTMLKIVGYGVSNIERALYSAQHELTLIAQNQIQPFMKGSSATASSDPKLNELQLYHLPWPIEVLQQLPANLDIQLKVTLSYFIEPNPARRGFRNRYSYQSHGLRFKVIRPEQSEANFRATINQFDVDDHYDGPEGDVEGWQFGPQIQTRGSIHSDTWTGSAAKLAAMHTLAVFPVGGWWKYKTGGERWENSVRYSLIVSIDAPDEDIDIYSEVESLIDTAVEIEVTI